MKKKKKNQKNKERSLWTHRFINKIIKDKKKESKKQACRRKYYE